MKEGLEDHYTIKQIAEKWHWSQGTVRSLFADEIAQRMPGSGKFSGKRSYISIRIPESSIIRVSERLKQKPTIVKLPRKEPKRIVRLRDRKAA